MDRERLERCLEQVRAKLLVASALMQHLLERTPNVIAQVSASLPPDFDEAVAQTIFGQLI